MFILAGLDWLLEGWWRTLWNNSCCRLSLIHPGALLVLLLLLEVAWMLLLHLNKLVVYPLSGRSYALGQSRREWKKGMLLLLLLFV